MPRTPPEERAAFNLAAENASLEARLRAAEEALVECIVPLEVLHGQAPYIRLGPLRKKVKALSPELFKAIAHAVELGRKALATASGEGEVGERRLTDAPSEHHSECSSQRGTGWCDCRSLPGRVDRAEPPGVVLSEAEEIARSVLQATWNDSHVPDYRPPAETFALWVGYAKKIARALLDRKGVR